MARLTHNEIQKALRRMGELALSQNTSVELIVVGGAAMVLVYNARESTQDVDSYIVHPKVARLARAIAASVAKELDLAEDWLNDGAKGYLRGYSDGGVVFEAPGITVRCPSPSQLLAMKLSAWRDDVDIADARMLLQVLMRSDVNHDNVWVAVEPYLIPGDEFRANASPNLRFTACFARQRPER